MLASNPLILFGSLFASTALLTWAVRLIAVRAGFVSRPKSDRWHTRVVALGGGIAIFAGIFGGLAVLGGPLFFRLGPAILVIFLLGLIDDFWSVPPVGKLFVQTAAAAYLAAMGNLLPIPFAVLAIAITIFWIVGMTNSLNLLDHIDGLSSGATLIACLGFYALLRDRPETSASANLALVVAGAAAGFLVHNFNPARIFMGDAGSLPLGFVLAYFATQVRVSNELPQALSLSLGILILIVPIFDTFLVMVARRNAHRPLMSGGRDHSSHRLVELGLSDRRAVLVLYVLGALGSFAAWLIQGTEAAALLVISISALVLLSLLGVFLLEIAVYPPEAQKEGVPRWKNREVAPGQYSLPILVLYFLELMLDVGIVALVWTIAHWIRFQDETMTVFSAYMAVSVIPRLPQLIVIKIACLVFFRLYRGLWRTITVDDVFRIFKAVTIASVILVVGSVFSSRLFQLSRIVIVMDWLMTFLGILGVRAAFSLFRQWSTKLASKPFKAAVLGTPELASVLRDAIDSERGVQYSGLILAQQEPHERDVVLGTVDRLYDVVRENGIDILFVPAGKESAEVRALIASGVVVRQVSIQLT